MDESYSVEKYKDCFDGRAYAQLNFNPEFNYELKTYPEDFLHRMFAEGKLRGKSLLDVGSGPTVRCAISASKFVPEIYLSDLVENNLEEILKWLKNDENAIDYTWQFQYVAKLENSDPDILEERVRSVIKGILTCNILVENPLRSKPVQQFDIVTSSFCIDCFTESGDYAQAIRNMASLLRPGGRLALLGTITCTKYLVGKVDFLAINSDVVLIKQTLKEAGLRILVFEERYVEDEALSFPNLEGEYGTVCVKLA